MRSFGKGDRVSQSAYGVGTIVEVDDQRTVIDFDEHGVRKFVSSMVNLTPTNEPATARAAKRRAKSAKPKTK